MLSPRTSLLAALACYFSGACGGSPPPPQDPVATEAEDRAPVTAEAEDAGGTTSPCGDQPCADKAKQSDQPYLKINLPSGEPREIDPESNSLVVSIRKDGWLMVNDKVIQGEDLDRIFEASFTQDPNTQVVLRAGPDVSHGLVVSVMDRARKAGLSRLAIAASPDTPQ